MAEFALVIASLALIMAAFAILFPRRWHDPVLEPPPAASTASKKEPVGIRTMDRRKPKVVDDYRAAQIEREQIKRRTPLA